MNITTALIFTLLYFTLLYYYYSQVYNESLQVKKMVLPHPIHRNQRSQHARDRIRARASQGARVSQEGATKASQHTKSYEVKRRQTKAKRKTSRMTGQTVMANLRAGVF